MSLSRLPSWGSQHKKRQQGAHNGPPDQPRIPSAHRRNQEPGQGTHTSTYHHHQESFRHARGKSFL
jgi:hypothetical protein